MGGSRRNGSCVCDKSTGLGTAKAVEECGQESTQEKVSSTRDTLNSTKGRPSNGNGRFPLLRFVHKWRIESTVCKSKSKEKSPKEGTLLSHVHSS